MGIDPVPKYKSQARDYMATFLDDLRQFFRDFCQFVVMASRKFRLEHQERGRLGSLEEHLVSSCFQVLMSMFSLFDAFLINLFDGLPDSASREL